MNQEDILNLLLFLRRQVLDVGIDKLGSHQLDAHWSLAYACGRPPEPWEVYRVPSIQLMPSTKFFINHPAEIQEAIQPYASWELLQEHAVEKLALDAGMTEKEKKNHGYPGRVAYFDFQTKRWGYADVQRVRWFDGRTIAMESIAQTKDDFVARVEARLAQLRRRAQDDPTQKRIDELASYEYYVKGQFQVNLKKFDAGKKDARAWLAKLETTQDFGKNIFSILRQAENDVRSAHGVPAVGESWVSETELLYRVRNLFPDIEIVAHGKPRWLGRQHLDIWIPSLLVAIEYHGLQHFQSVEFFGGEDAFLRGQERDQRKRTLCVRNGVRLIEIAYDDIIDDLLLQRLVVGTDVGAS